MRVVRIFLLLGLWGLVGAVQAQSLSDYYCAVEVGSKGIKGRLFRFGGQVLTKDESPFETPYSKDINTNLVGSMEGKNFSRASMDATIVAIATMIAEMKLQQSACKTVVVGSSGLLRAENKLQLADLIKEKFELPMEFITADQEATYGFMGAIPRAEWDKALFMDIGSGNTKLSFMRVVGGKSKLENYEIPFGTSSLTAKAAGGGADFSKAVDSIIDAEARPAFRAKMAAVPSMMNYKSLFVAGGVIWASATFMYPDKAARRFVKITDPDLELFRQAIATRTWSDSSPSLIAFPAARKAFKKDSQTVLDIFNRDNMIAGHAIWKMVTDASGSHAPTYFARHGGWIFGYVQDKFKSDAWGGDSIEDHL